MIISTHKAGYLLIGESEDRIPAGSMGLYSNGLIEGALRVLAAYCIIK
jgi:hypothetical protein